MMGDAGDEDLSEVDDSSEQEGLSEEDDPSEDDTSSFDTHMPPVRAPRSPNSSYKYLSQHLKNDTDTKPHSAHGTTHLLLLPRRLRSQSSRSEEVKAGSQAPSSRYGSMPDISHSFVLAASDPSSRS